MKVLSCSPMFFFFVVFFLHQVFAVTPTMVKWCHTAAGYCSYLTTLTVTDHPLQICLTRVWQCCALLFRMCLFPCVWLCGVCVWVCVCPVYMCSMVCEVWCARHVSFAEHCWFDTTTFGSGQDFCIRTFNVFYSCVSRNQTENKMAEFCSCSCLFLFFF